MTDNELLLALSNRYKSGVTQIEAIQEDVTILKTVVTEHSQKLQKIS